MLGLKIGTVTLLPHDIEWDKAARITIGTLKKILGNSAIDIQHIGSTAIKEIHAKPIIDIAVGVDNFNSVLKYRESLESHGVIFRGSDIKGQLLFVIGDFDNDTRTHHIHVVEYNSRAWNDYINFRDYLNTHPDIAKEYDTLKSDLARKYGNDRIKYTENKVEFIDMVLKLNHK